ncbi:MAG: C1 family peptidase [candidate division Zixibacteria bacterium]
MIIRNAYIILILQLIFNSIILGNEIESPDLNLPKMITIKPGIPDPTLLQKDIKSIDAKAAVRKIPEKFKNTTLPFRWDWREKGIITAVQDQDWPTCGSCYSFGALANVESMLQMDGAGVWNLSENHIKECNWHDLSCDGGGFSWVSCVLSENGTVLESCDPYIPANVSCKTDCDFQHTLLGLRTVTDELIPDPELIKNYLYTYGPMEVGMGLGDFDTEWYDELMAYDGSYTLYYSELIWGIGHSVLIVGWDDDLIHEGGTGGWIIKNSMGTSWGGPCGSGTEGGYATIGYGVAYIGIFPEYMSDWQPYDHNGGILFYDEAGPTRELGFSSNTAWGMCKYVIENETYITRVEFWTNDPTTDIDIYIYDDFDGSVPSNLLSSSLDHSFVEYGYFSIILPEPLAVSIGDDIYVVTNVTNEQHVYPIMGDGDGPQETGYTFVSADGELWFDAGLLRHADVGIRLRYSNVPCIDSDGDGFGDPDYWGNQCDLDNCPDTYNSDQIDSDGDNIGDACDYKRGDANSDDNVNVGDAVYIINYVFKNGPGPDRLECGDANCDGDCNVGDAVFLINHVFKDGLSPEEACN